MKRLLLILLIVSLLNLTSPVLSQDAELGFKLGANISLIDGDGFSEFVMSLDDEGDEDIGVRWSPAFTAGIFVSIGIFDFLAVQSELFFSNVGATYGYDDATLDPDQIDGVLNVMMLEIPILLKPRFELKGGLMYFLIGPDLITLLGPVRLVEQRGDSVVSVSFTPDNDFLIGGIVGLGYAYPIGAGLALLEVRYMRTLFVGFKENDKSFYINEFNLMLGYEFILGGA
jgi:hypothetical protein